jgi:hypothetical protein
MFALTDMLANKTISELKMIQTTWRKLAGIDTLDDVPMTIWCKSHWLFSKWMPAYAEYRKDNDYKARE